MSSTTFQHILLLPHDDWRITYGPTGSQWVSREMRDILNRRRSVIASDGSVCRALVLFRGNGFRFYGGGSGRIWASVDDDPLTLLNITTELGHLPILNQTFSEDKDHQLLIRGEGNIWIERIALESTSGQFDPLEDGLNATSIPKEAVIVEDNSDSIKVSSREQWQYTNDEIYSGNSLLQTNFSGSSLTYTFEGISIWVYGDRDQRQGVRGISIDDGPEELVNTRLTEGHTMRRLIWQRTGLQPDVEHKLTMTHRGNPDEWITLDYFRVLKSPSSQPTDTLNEPNVDQSSSKNLLGLFTGIPIGVTVIAVAIAFFMIRRKQKKRLSSHGINSMPSSRRTFHEIPDTPSIRQSTSTSQTGRFSSTRENPFIDHVTVNTGFRSPVPSSLAFSTSESEITYSENSSDLPNTCSQFSHE